MITPFMYGHGTLYRIQIVDRLADAPHLFDIVLNEFKAGLGVHWADRKPPTGNESCVFITRDHEVISAFTTFFPTTDYVGQGQIMWLDLMFVAEAQRGKGLGRWMIEAIEERTPLPLGLGTGGKNTAMRTLAESAGMEPDAVYYIMQRTIK